MLFIRNVDMLSLRPHQHEAFFVVRDIQNQMDFFVECLPRSSVACSLSQVFHLSTSQNNYLGRLMFFLFSRQFLHQTNVSLYLVVYYHTTSVHTMNLHTLMLCKLFSANIFFVILLYFILSHFVSLSQIVYLLSLK